MKKQLTNEEFFERHAKPGCVGLVGGPQFLDQVIRRAQRLQTATGAASPWSHAFIFQGRRADGRHWIIESDIELHGSHARIGVQENRVDKYHDPRHYDSLAVLDFGLSAAAVEKVIGAGLALTVARTKYSLRECLGVYLRYRLPKTRAVHVNVLSQDNSLFCSSLVRRVYLDAGVDLHPGLDAKLTSPEDLAQTPLPHKRRVLIR